MDTFSEYNQIMINLVNEEKTTFIIHKDYTIIESCPSRKKYKLSLDEYFAYRFVQYLDNF